MTTLFNLFVIVVCCILFNCTLRVLIDTIKQGPRKIRRLRKQGFGINALIKGEYPTNCRTRHPVKDYSYFCHTCKNWIEGIND